MDRGAWWATVHGVTDMTVLDMTEHALACMHRKYTEKKIKKKNKNLFGLWEYLTVSFRITVVFSLPVCFFFCLILKLSER